MLLQGDSWHIESSGLGRKIAHKIRQRLFYAVEEFPALRSSQRVEIFDFSAFGKGLVIDGMCQLAEAIDTDYTNALVHPAAFSASSRKRWLLAGAGDGAAAREALRYSDTEEVYLVDISETVIRETQYFIPSFWEGCQNDPRLTIVPRDIFEFMKTIGKKFHIVVCDLSDPSNSNYTPFAISTADHLYTPESLALFSECLEDDGIFVMQAQEFSLLSWENHKKLLVMLKAIYPSVHSYRIFIEFFGYWQSFIIASKVPNWELFGADGFKNRVRFLLRVSETFHLTMDETIDMVRHLSSLFTLPINLRRKLEV